MTCEMCGEVFRRDNLRRHNLICRKRLVNACLQNSPFSNSSRVSDEEDGADIASIVNIEPVEDVAAPIEEADNNSPRFNANGEANDCLQLVLNFPCGACNRPHTSMAARSTHERVHSTS